MAQRLMDINDEVELRRVLDACKVIRLGLWDGEEVYVVPMNHGYDLQDGKLTFYLHGAFQGRKMDILQRNPKVGFELDCDHALKTATGPCAYGYYYSSIIGNGTVTILKDPAEKAAALNNLMEHQVGKPVPVPEKATSIVNVFRLDVSKYSAKQHLPGPAHD